MSEDEKTDVEKLWALVTRNKNFFDLKRTTNKDGP